MTKIAVFDFDGTLTIGDSFLGFVRYVKGTKSLMWGVIKCFPYLLAYAIGVCSNTQAKEKLFSCFFKGMNYSVFCKYGVEFSSVLERKTNPISLGQLHHHVKKGSKVYIISASMAEWIRPWAKAYGVTDVIGTKPEVDAVGYLTGHFCTKNCFGAEKVRRFLEIEPNRSSYCLVAYGDSRGDKEILAFADEGYFVGRHF